MSGPGEQHGHGGPTSRCYLFGRKGQRNACTLEVVKCCDGVYRSSEEKPADLRRAQRAVAATGERKKKLKNGSLNPPPSLPEPLLGLSQSAVSIAGRPTNQKPEQERQSRAKASLGRADGGRVPAPPLPAPPPERPGPPRARPDPAQGPPKARPAAASRACLESPGQRPAAGAEYCLKGRKKRKAGRAGNCSVAGRGFITFSFVVDNIAKCVKVTASPGQDREGADKVSSFFWRWGHREKSEHHLPRRAAVAGSASGSAS